MTNAKTSGLFPNPTEAATKARECADHATDQRLRNAYSVLSDVLLELADARRTILRLEVELGR